MKIYITCSLEDPESDEADRLLPFVARSNVRGVEARSATPEAAINHVKGVVLHWLGSMPEPPDEIRFFSIVLNPTRPPCPSTTTPSML